MTIYTPPNLTAGIDDAIVTTVAAVPEFMIMFLVFIFGTVLIGGALSQKRREGTADLPMWTTLASLSTLLITMPLTLTTGIIQLEVLSVVVVITIFSGLWLFLDRGKNEF